MCSSDLIGEARGTADERRIDADIAARAMPVNQHLAGYGAARHSRLQRAEPVGQLFGQHRQYRARQIDAGSPQPGFAVEWRTCLHIGGHIGNGDPDAIPCPFRLRRHGVVKIPRVLPVDGHVDLGAQVAPLSRDIGSYLGALQLGVGLDIAEGFGLTETSPVTHCNPLGGQRKIGSIVIPMPNTDQKIVDLEDSSVTLPPNQDGELLIVGPQAIQGNWGSTDWTDIQAVTRFMQKHPSINPSRIGVMGGSYGGYMTNWIVGHTNEFRGAITDRCVSNLVSMGGNSDFMDKEDGYFGGDQKSVV